MMKENDGLNSYSYCNFDKVHQETVLDRMMTIPYIVIHMEYLHSFCKCLERTRAEVVAREVNHTDPGSGLERLGQREGALVGNEVVIQVDLADCVFQCNTEEKNRRKKKR